MHLDRDKIYNLYENTILKESPDNIEISGRIYQYDDKSLGNYTGFLNIDGYFAMSNEVNGHGQLISMAKAGLKLIHNLSSDDQARDFIRRTQGKEEFRIWPKFEVFSMWAEYDPRFAAAAVDAIKATGKNPEIFIFDVGREGMYKDVEDGMRYDEFVGTEMSDEYIEKEQERNTRKAQDERMLADYKLGNLPNKNKGFNYRREGD